LRMVGYWGQSSSSRCCGIPEQSLAYFCASTNWDIINVAFVSAFGTSPFEINLSSHMNGVCDPNVANGCQSVGNDILTCQNTYNKTIMLSLGGGSGSYGLSSVSQANALADDLWNRFLGGSSTNRPFGQGVRFNGVDLDIELGGSGPSQHSYFTALVNQLRTHFSVGQYYISAAPQCVFPDSSLGPDGSSYTNSPLSHAVFDYVWIQFYNNGSPCYGCNIGDTNFATSIQQWATWAQNTNTKFFIGALGDNREGFIGEGGCPPGYVDADTLKNAVTNAANMYPNSFGGVMLWDVSAEQVNGGFVLSVATHVHSIGLTTANPTTSSSRPSTSSSRPSTSSSRPSTSSSRPSTSSSSSTTSIGTSSSGNEPCSQSGSQRCSSANPQFYQTCANGQWGPSQSCNSGTVCSPSGNNIYCVSAPVTSEPCTSGQMRYTGPTTYQTCANNGWGPSQSCASGSSCSASPPYIYCI